jgi:integrase
MATPSAPRKRVRGEIETLPSGPLRVRVYAGVDPVSKKRHYLVETVAAGSTAAKDAEKVRTRLLNQVDERRNPRTRATLNQLLDRWLEVAELEPTTRSGYVRKLDKHVRPVLGGVQVGRLDAETLEQFNAAEHLRSQLAGSHALANQVTGWLLATQARLGMTGDARAALAGLDEQQATLRRSPQRVRGYLPCGR